MLQDEDAETFSAHSDVPPRTLANQTAGLGYVQLRTLLADVLENHRRLTFERLQERKKELIEAEAYGLLEFVHTELRRSTTWPATPRPRSTSETPPAPSARGART
jgi:hypothetical protein